MTEQRVRFRDIKPYEIVDSLDELAGPAEGPVTLPVDVYWSGPFDTFDVADKDDRVLIYSATLSNGRRHQIAEFVNRDLLIQEWPYLTIDSRVVDLWTGRFPELAARGRVA